MHHIRSLTAYGMTSVGALAVELAILHLALTLRALPPVAVSCGFIAGSVFQFCALRYAVFRVADKPVHFQASAYVIAAIGSWWAVVLTVALLQNVTHLPTMQARLVSIPLLFPLNYLVSKYFIFRR